MGDSVPLSLPSWEGREPISAPRRALPDSRKHGHLSQSTVPLHFSLSLSSLVCCTLGTKLACDTRVHDKEEGEEWEKQRNP